MSQGYLLPFAKRLSDNQLVAPDEVPRGLACECVCPGCGHPVIARHGTEKVWHFAHAKSSDCANAYEKSVHEMAKQLLRERKVFLVPKLEVIATASDAFGRCLSKHETVFDSKAVALDECSYGTPLDGVTPDVIGHVVGRDVLVEITVFHRLMPDKRERLVATGKPSFEINLSIFKTVQPTRERLEAQIFEDPTNRGWIFHPKQVEASERLHQALKPRLEQANAEFEAHQEMAAKARALAAHAQAETTKLQQLAREASQAWRAQSCPNGLAWRASFPATEKLDAAKSALCSRLELGRERVEVVTSAYSKRSDLARTNPEELATEWAAALGVSTSDIYRFFFEAGYTRD